MTGGDEMSGFEDLDDTLTECSEDMMLVYQMWPGASDEQRMTIRSLLGCF